MEGHYALADTLNIENGQVVDAYGATIRHTGAGPAISLGVGSKLLGATIIGPGTGNGIITRTNASRWAIRDVKVQSFAAGLLLQDTWIGTYDNPLVEACDVGIKTASLANAVTVRGGEIKGCGKGVELNVGNNIVLDGAAIEGNDTHGVHLQTTTNALRIWGCYFELNGTYDVLISQAGRSAVIRDSQFLTTPTSVSLNAGIGAIVEGNFFQPGGATPKSLEIGSFSENVVVGRNVYLAGAFDPATDDSGTNTTVV